MQSIESLLGAEAHYLLSHECQGLPASSLHLPGPDFIERVHLVSDRKPAVLRNLGALFGHGRLGDSGYLSILPVDQGVEHSAGASFARNPLYFDPDNVLRLAIEGGCSAVASTLGVLGSVARRYVHRVPFIVKLNHNETLSLPLVYDQTPFADVDQAFEMGAIGVGATVYFGSPNSRRQLVEVSQAFKRAHELGLFTVLWCYLRNGEFKRGATDYHAAADLTGQANHLGVTIEADLIKQKMAETNGGYTELQFGKHDPRMYSQLASDHPVDLVRYQVANCFMGRSGLINSGGESVGAADLAQAVRAAVINKRAGGMGLIIGRKAFQKPMEEGVQLLHAVQDVYLSASIGIA